jgi:predicted ferric reductase
MQLRRQLFLLFFGVQVVGITVAWWLANSSRVTAGGDVALIAFGGLCGLLAGYFFLQQMILISGASFIERHFGLDRLARIHHTTGLIGYVLLLLHVTFIVAGYASLNNASFPEQFLDLRNNFAYVGLASIALLLLDAVVITSIVIVRKRLKYELWYFVHLLVYSAVLLALLHQINNGQSLLGNEYLRFYWYVLYIAAFGLVLWRRWLLPIFLEHKHRLRVQKVEKENESVTSIYITGKNLAAFKYDAGQFNLWQFWQKGLRSMHHPFTISSSPGDPYLRLSAKAIGDFTSKLDEVKVGTPVLISGPYGLFSRRVSAGRPRLFIAGGIGITPILSMLRDEVKKGDVLLYAAQSREDAVFAKDFKQLASRGLKTSYIFSNEKVKGSYNGHLNKQIINKEVTQITKRDVWLCGPPPMMNAVEQALTELRVPKDQIHTEKFRL